MEYQILMKTAIMAGESLLKSGAETYRVEDTMEHILKTSGLSHVEVHATITGIMATIAGDELDQPITMITRIKERGTHLNQIVRVNDVSRRYCGEEISLNRAYHEMQEISKTDYRGNHYSIAIMMIVTGFTLMFGGEFMECLASLAVGAILAGTLYYFKRLRTDAMIQDIAASFLLTLTALLLKAIVFPDMNLDTVIIGAIMPLVPGVAITNAVRDTLQGDYVSGCARVLEAFLKAAAIAIGVGAGMALYAVMG
ncbi:MAG TPA: threonine/serine exporter [Lachnospiraceae bacterium]|nr:threonine/serine exporter [Lachnospiraceae bacterium]